MELSPSWEANSHSATSILRNRAVAMITTTRLWSLSWDGWIQPIPPSYFSKIRFNNILKSTSYQQYLSFWLSHQNPVCIPISHAYYITWPSQPPWFDQSNYIWLGVQVMMLIIMQYPLTNFEPKRYLIVRITEFKFVLIRIASRWFIAFATFQTTKWMRSCLLGLDVSFYIFTY
jgi:hypothetical protein